MSSNFVQAGKIQKLDDITIIPKYRLPPSDGGDWITGHGENNEFFPNTVIKLELDITPSGLTCKYFQSIWIWFFLMFYAPNHNNTEINLYDNLTVLSLSYQVEQHLHNSKSVDVHSSSSLAIFSDIQYINCCIGRRHIHLI